MLRLVHLKVFIDKQVGINPTHTEVIIMLYPAYVEIGNETTAYGAVLPDFDYLATACDNEEDLPKSVQDAVETYFLDEDYPLPKPSSLASVKNDDFFDYDGVWVMFDINTSKLSAKSKRFNATLPENLLNDIDNYVAKQGISRSGFLAEASRSYLSAR